MIFIINNTRIFYVICFVYQLILIFSQINVNLYPMGYNYFMYLNISGENSKFIIDTGNSQFTALTYNPLENFAVSIQNPNLNNYECLSLLEDNSNIYFRVQYNNHIYFCNVSNTIVALDSYSIKTSVLVTNHLSIQNSKLHNWNTTNGDIGLGYYPCGYTSSCGYTTFQQLIGAVNYTDSYIFGLDLNNYGISTMQLGYVLSEYENNLIWMAQPQQYPTYHQFLLNDLEICGRSLLSNISSNWPVIVDTGSVCVNLPSEIYTTFISWINITEISINDINLLPSLSFIIQNEESSQVLNIPLSTLLLNDTVYEGTSGAPTINVNGTSYGICVLEGPSVQSTDVPLITLGTLALHSIYFAADFTNNSVGLASKLDDNQINSLSSTSMCSSQTICYGDQMYSQSHNSCNPPDCNKYFFTKLNPNQQTCSYSSTAVGFGITIVVILSILELFSFFTMQYSAYQSLKNNRNSNAVYAISKIDPITQYIGYYTTKVIDHIVIHILQWVHINNNNDNQQIRNEIVTPRNGHSLEDIDSDSNNSQQINNEN